MPCPSKKLCKNVLVKYWKYASNALSQIGFAKSLNTNKCIISNNIFSYVMNLITFKCHLNDKLS